MCLNSLGQNWHALLTILIAIITLFIAWQQLQANKLKLRLERYERRMKIYEEVKKILILAIQDRNVQINELMNFRGKAAEADFLFGPQIPQYIEEIYFRGLKLCRANTEYRDLKQVPPPGYDHNKVVEEINSQFVWFTEQLQEAKRKFKNYLDISK